jgi:HPt (histidine-containing phosphotransfer) domain-containing protein
MSTLMAAPEVNIGPSVHGIATSHPSGKMAPRSATFDPTALLTRVWKQNLPIIRERVALLEEAGAQADAGTLTPARRQEAADAAHKLAGSLGMFGYPEGTRIARMLEGLFESEATPDSSELVKLSAELRQALPLAG